MWGDTGKQLEQARQRAEEEMAAQERNLEDLESGPREFSRVLISTGLG